MLRLRQGYEDSDLTDLPPYHSDSPFAHLTRIDLDVLTFSSPIPLTSPPTIIFLPVMSTTVTKEFSEVPKLSSDGSNYRIWLGRIERATGACEAEDLLVHAVDSSSAAELKLNKQMLNAITGKFPDSLFKKYISVTEVHSVMSGLKTEFGMSTAASEAWTEAKLFSLRCTDERKVCQHLDQLSELKDKLSEMNVKIEDRTYINAITTSIPHSFAPVVTAIATAINIYNSTLATGATRRIVTSAEIIKALRAEADSCAVLKTTDKSVAANAAFTNGCGGTRGREHGTSNGKVKTDAKPKDGATKDSSASAVIAAPESSAHIEEAWSACTMIPYEEEIVIDCSDLAAQEEVHIPDTYHAFASIIESGRRIDIFDSGASRHMMPHLDRLLNFCTTTPHQIHTVNSEVFYLHGVGDMLLHLPAENGSKHIRLKGVLHVPKMHTTLISLGVVEAAGFAWLGYDGNLIICNQHNDIVISVPCEDHLYQIFYDSAHASLATSAVQLSLFEIHKRLGHVNYGYLKAMIRQN
ncbi:Retrovirus-related Pol polyprotein from transposon TNT 1-94 [Grifola frondosa]|uniref:Retrovirus-related Pol polyprotein from transposon TNT 1-94 n=1 Tax=Grifola frondosa TaxID=5627 RepID=A0A1C7LZZ6_GRIFR|nr:Retrovirus-related Pol polyprotein from transposon TNT 1-94 [Grifola frondosa]